MLTLATFVVPPIREAIIAVFVLVIVGVCLWLIQTKIKMDDVILNIIRVVVVLVACAWLLHWFGLI